MDILEAAAASKKSRRNKDDNKHSEKKGIILIPWLQFRVDGIPYILKGTITHNHPFDCTMIVWKS